MYARTGFTISKAPYDAVSIHAESYIVLESYEMYYYA